MSCAARGCSQSSDNQRSWNRWGPSFALEIPSPVQDHKGGQALVAELGLAQLSECQALFLSSCTEYSFNFSRFLVSGDQSKIIPHFHLFLRTSGTSETHSGLRFLSTRQIRIRSSRPHHPTWPTPPVSTSMSSRPRPPLARSTPREIPGPDSTIPIITNCPIDGILTLP